MHINRFVRLDKRSSGLPTLDQFSLNSETISGPGEGEYIVRNHFIACDPALIGRLRSESNYAESVEPGEVMHAYCVGEVIESHLSDVPEGQMLYGRFDMQQYCLANADTFAFPIDVSLAPAQWYLGVLGTTGATAYFALNEICEPVAGQCLVVSSAASSVGSIAGQLGKQQGCHVVGIVSTPEKASAACRDYGYDAVVSYRDKSTPELGKALAEQCPAGVDMYFDNTSGDISEALLELYNEHARVAVVGRMALSHLEDTSLDTGRRDNSVLLAKRIRKQGFVVRDFFDRMPEAVSALSKLVKSGELVVKEDVLNGIERAPEAFMRVVSGSNTGKQLVRLA
ncbi:MAG: NADP-dependent oxidoreductase [Pseudomonadota bacterium]